MSGGPPPRVVFVACLLALALGELEAQTPRIAAVYPPGGKAGTTLDVEIRGGVAGARDVLVFGNGVHATLASQAAADDPEAKALHARKCGTCHELRSPENRQLSPTDWERTVDRMIDKNAADISKPERDRIVAWLRARAAAGKVTATITIDPDALPGRRELRVVNAAGVSTAYPFCVSEADETLEVEPNNDFDQATPVTLPLIFNGACEANGDVDLLRFSARRGQRVVFRGLAYGLLPETQSYFDLCLFLYDSGRRLVADSLGFDDLDPLLDYTIPADGEYTLEIRDLIYRGAAGDVYRIEAGELGYHQAIYPLGGRRGQLFEAVVMSENQPDRAVRQTLAAGVPLGIGELVTPFGSFPFHYSDLPEQFDQGDDRPQVLKVPCVVNGWLGEPGERDRYLLRIGAEEVRVLTRWAVIGPFDGGEAGLDTPLGPEPDLLAGRFAADRTYPGADGPLAWELRATDENGNLMFPAGQNQVWYAFHAFELREALAATLAVGTDDGCRIWANGELVHHFRGARPVTPAEDLVPVRFRAGVNTLVFKIFNVSGPAGLTASAQAWSLEVFARRLGSPLRPRLRLGFGQSWLADRRDGPGGDARLDWSFGRPGDYGLQIEDADGRGGARFGYRIAIQPSRPSATLQVYPANPSVPRGGRVPVLVQRSSLNGYRGDLRLRVQGLPVGLTADEAVLPADAESAVITLSAAADAPAGHGAVRVTADIPALPDEARWDAVPLDFFQIQNNRLPMFRRSMVAAALAQPAAYRLTAEPTALPVRAGGAATVRVRLERAAGFTGDVNLVALGLPRGVRASNAVVGGGRSEAGLELSFAPNLLRDGFGESPTPDAYRFVVAGLSGGDGITGGTSYCSAPIVLQPPQPGGATVREPARPQQAAVHPGRAVMERRCGTCHALIDPLQTRKTASAWTATVDRMISQHNAPIPAAERAQIVAYLAEVARGQ